GRRGRDADRARELVPARALAPDEPRAAELGVVDDDAVVAGVARPHAPVRRDRDPARPVELGRHALRHRGEGAAEDPPVPRIRDVQRIAADRDAAELAEAELAGSASAPAAEGPALGIVDAEPRVAEVRDPDPPAAVDRHPPRLPQAGEGWL